MKNTNDSKVHIGKLLADHYKDKKVSYTEIGRAMGLESTTISYHQKREELNTGIIFKYSMFFRHNFFLDLAEKLPKDFTTNAPQAKEELAIIAKLQEELQALKDEFKIVKAERDLLKEIMGKK